MGFAISYELLPTSRLGGVLSWLCLYRFGQDTYVKVLPVLSKFNRFCAPQNLRKLMGFATPTRSPRNGRLCARAH